MAEYEKGQYYQQALALVDQGNHQEAVGYFCEHLKSNPDDVEALNDLGTVYYCMGDNDKAIEFIERAWKLSPDNGQICWNLIETYLAVGMTKWAVRLFDDLGRMGLENADVYTRAAKQFVDNGDAGSAVEMLLKSLDYSDEQEILYPMLKTLKGSRPRIAFVNGNGCDYKFITDIVNYFDKRFDVRFANSANFKELDETMAWADIVWFEWATDKLVYASSRPRACKIVTRLHRFEAYREWFGEVKWENVDKLILVGNSYLKSHILTREPMIDVITDVVTIANGIDLDKFRFRRRQKGKNIACVGHINMRKNPMLLLQCMQKLNYIDKDYRLFFAGDFQDKDLEQYMRYSVREMGLQDAIIFEGWQGDVSNWLDNKHYIVSGSVAESQGLGLLEGMACGLKPVLHNFPGAYEIFDSKYTFNIAEEFCEQVLNGDYNSIEYRKFVEIRYPQSKQFDAINKLFCELEGKIGKGAGLTKDSIAGMSAKLSAGQSFNANSFAKEFSVV